VFKPSITTKTVTDGTVQATKNFKDLAALAVYVGIPESDPARKSGVITNAQLAFIHTHGVRSVDARRIMGAMMINRGINYEAARELYVRSRGSMAFSIPPRPIIEPAIENNENQIIPELRAAAEDQLASNHAGAVRNMKRAGMAGQNAAKGWFFDPRNQWPPNKPSTIARKKSDKPLIDTGQLRAAITYIVSDK